MLQWLSDSLSSLLTLIESLVGLIFNTLNGLVTLVTSLPSIINGVSSLSIIIPNFAIPIFTIFLSVTVILFIVDRRNKIE